MEPVDYLFTNAIVLTMDKQMHIYEPGAVAVSKDVIVRAGPEDVLKKDFSAYTVIDCQKKVLMPGLINAHTHVPMTLLRGLADDLRLDVWLMGYMMPVEREFVSLDFVRLGTQLACAEMIRSGVTTFADMYYFEDEVARATEKAGMRAVCSQSIMKFPTPDSKSAEDSLAYTRAFIQRWKDNPLIVPSIAPHAAYTCTDEILQACAAMAVEFDVPLHTHISETSVEVENMRKEIGIPVVPYMKQQNLFTAKVLAAHCVHIDEGEIRTLKSYNAGVSHNPSSNLKLASGFAPIKKMLDAGINVGIGTDGPASNNDLDMFEEIRLASFVGKCVTNDPTALPAETVLLMATRMGANALHIGNITGSLEPGKRADLILVDMNTLHNIPRFRRDPKGIYAQLIYAAKATDVSDVMINGQWVMRDRQILTIDTEIMYAEIEAYAHKIDTFLLQREQSILSKLIAIGGASEEESFEVQVKVPLKDIAPILAAIQKPEIEILRSRHYREYDTYFAFTDVEQGYIRYREDEFIGEENEIINVRSRLTHIGPTVEQRYPQEVVLSRSRYIAPATQSLRFYREYFKPAHEWELEKERLRYLVRFQNTEFFINVDEVKKPGLGCFLEVKSRTWSEKDAEEKANLATQLIVCLGASPDDALVEDYVDLIFQKR